MTRQQSMRGRRELAALNDALTVAELGLARRQSPAALLTRLLRAAALHHGAVDGTLMWQVTDLVNGDEMPDRFKLRMLRMAWASIVQSMRRRDGLWLVGDAARPGVRAA